MRTETTAPEIWGGLECSCTRVEDWYSDQIERSGHQARATDLDRIAALGIRAVRYPVLWERTTTSTGRHEWTWAEERLARWKALGVRPIVGLVHHGSGPRWTNLLAEDFATGLAAYARQVAERFPWVTDYTPVNEPVTTARFSALYGVWYPHERRPRTFVAALLNELRAIVLSMRAVREVNPEARLIHTEDAGRVFSTRPLAYQAEFENERLELGVDLLRGAVNRQHVMYKSLIGAGASEAEVAWFEEHPCPPDILALNYYATSDRFLDHRLDRYPLESHGGNGKERYADVAAVRARPEGIEGHLGVLRRSWARHRLPLAFGEVHLGCTREEQLRWLVQAWDAACDARRDGIDVRALCAWALIGSYDWDSLLVRRDGHYEPGVFDLRAPEPRPTALAHAVASLAAGERPSHPVLQTPGWWARPDRLLHDGCEDEHQGGVRPDSPAVVPYPLRSRPRPLLIAGARGTLGEALTRACRVRGLEAVSLSRADLDIADASAVARALDRHRPWAVVNAGGYVRVDDAEEEAEACFRANSTGPRMLAEACQSHGVPLATFSSDLVFDGREDRPYVETDPVAPLNVYGRSKIAAEREVLSACPGALVCRTSAFFGPWDEANFVTQTLRALQAGQRVAAAGDLVVSPTYVPDLVHAVLDLLMDGEAGLWHLANQGAVTWAGFAREVALASGLDPRLVEERPASAMGYRAARPRQSALASERGHLLPPLAEALARYLLARVAAPAPLLNALADRPGTESAAPEEDAA